MASNTIIDKLDSHCVLVVGVGRTTSGEIYLHIQNTYGTEWGENGYGFVSLNLFEQLQGIKDASVTWCSIFSGIDYLVCNLRLDF
jgi:C1A family cysteine protease